MEVMKQCKKIIKVVRSYRGGEYYGKYDESGQNMGAFAKFLQGYEIVPQYTMLGTSEQNDVSERLNQTPKDIVRSMMSRIFFPEYLWVKV